MARNYTNFVEDLQEWAENDDSEFVAEIPQIMEMVELDLSRRLRHLDFYKATDVGQSTIIGTGEYTKPEGFVTTLSLTATVGTRMVFIHERPQSFLDFYWSDVTAMGSPPKYYASLSETQIRIAPTPNAVWPLTWVHTIRPTPLSPDNPMNWFTKNAYDVLFNRGMYYAEMYTKNTEKAMGWAQVAEGLIVALGGEAVAQHQDEASGTTPTPGR